MGYMCRRHATVSCENVSRDPMGPPVIFTSCLLPSGAPQAASLYGAPCYFAVLEFLKTVLPVLGFSFCLVLFSPNIVNDIKSKI